MDAPHTSYRVISVSIVMVLAAAAVASTFVNAVVASVLVQTGQWWPTAFAIVYLTVAVAAPALVVYRARRSGKTWLGVAQPATLALLTINLLAAPVSIAAMVM
ncbi:MAG TPA: hypothetical protein VE379_05515 [Vicinamibacterales bacterium]|nr:hypothetical protein [Vicinamibacterales bacterium]